MADYWDARAYPAQGGPSGSGLYYEMPPTFTGTFTPRPDPDTGLSIEAVEMQVMNMHPEQIAALADQWQNAYTLLSQIKHYVLEQSIVLYNEHWKSPEARDAFMKTGPGQALAYLDMWMESVNNNITSLRGLVHIVNKARTDVQDLMRRYEQELQT